MMDKDAEILLTVEKGIGRITLNRPRALNAINHAMVMEIARALDICAREPSVQAVWIEGAGERAFCAGGDVVAVSHAGQEQTSLCQDFFKDEYRLNRAIHLFPKPYIAFLDGIVMGGGVGLSIHGKHRIVTEHTLFAMPETAIGLFPDVGGSYFLPRCPGDLGIYLGLTGARLKSADQLAVGLADYYIERRDRDALLKELEGVVSAADYHSSMVDDVLKTFSKPAPGEPEITHYLEEINTLFAGNDLDVIVARLEAASTDFAKQALAFLSSKSPMLLKVSLEQLRRGADMDFDACMTMEYRMVRRSLMPGSDFHEGVRALLIDKDKTPVWSPAILQDVRREDVASFFVSPPEGDLLF